MDDNKRTQLRTYQDAACVFSAAGVTGKYRNGEPKTTNKRFNAEAEVIYVRTEACALSGYPNPS